MPENTRIDSVIQQIKLRLDEKGVKAAAVTELGVATADARIDEPIVVHVDRPFYYFVLHGRSIVLCGVVYDPSKG